MSFTTASVAVLPVEWRRLLADPAVDLVQVVGGDPVLVATLCGGEGCRGHERTVSPVADSDRHLERQLRDVAVAAGRLLSFRDPGIVLELEEFVMHAVVGYRRDPLGVRTRAVFGRCRPPRPDAQPGRARDLSGSDSTGSRS